MVTTVTSSDHPLVSVIIPTHNRPDFLYKTIKSILDQTYSNIEVIVVSNGYNPNNKQTVDRFADSKITYIEQENSGGPAAPRNHGIRLAKGELIAFCDDDDLWVPDKLAKQVKALLSDHNYGACYSKMLRFDETGREWAVPLEEGAANLDSLLYINTVPISSLIVTKKLIDQIGGFCKSKIVRFSEDYEFILKCAAVTKFAYVDEYLIRYWSGKHRTTLIDQQFTALEKLGYLMGIFGCYYLQIKSNRIKLTRLLLPSLYHIKIVAKIIVYLWYAKLKKLCNFKLHQIKRS